MPTAVVLEKRRRRGPNAARKAILRAARAMLCERGPEAVTVSEVAHRARVNRTTAYQHFRTREELIGAAITELADEVSRMLEADVPMGERIDLMIRYFLDHPEVARLWMFHLLANIRLPDREGWNRYLRTVEGFASSDAAQEGIEPEMLAYILMAAALVWSLEVRTEPNLAADVDGATSRFVRELKRLLLFGVVKPEKSPDLLAALKRTGDGGKPKEEP